MKYSANIWFLLAMSASALFVTGCSSVKHQPGELSEIRAPIKKIQVYTIGPGDTLEAFYYKDYQRSTVYKLGLEDKIFINVVGHEKYSREVTILPDGTVSIPKYGVIKAEGLTISELDAVITDLHSKELNTPEVDVLMVRAQSRSNEFLNSLGKGQQLGGSVPVKVGADGIGVLPIIGGVALQGLSLEEAQQEIMARYKRTLSNIAVTLNLSDSAQSYIAVIGEVRNPGVYSISSPVVPLHALALAGGGEPTADLEQIAVLRAGNNGAMKTILVSADETSAWEKNRLNNNYIMAGDIVFVPSSGIADINVFIDQYVRKMLPFTFSVGGFWDLSD